MSAPVQPLRERKAALLAAAQRLCARHPGGWVLEDLRRELGVCASEDARLRRFLLAREGTVLRRVSQGEYAAGPELHSDGALGVGVELVAEVDDAFRDAGGVLSFAELLAALGRDQGGGWSVRMLLTQSPRYASGTPWSGFRQCWRLVERERKRVPLPGRLLRFEVLAMLDAMSPLSRRAEWDIVPALAALRGRIGSALTAARDAAGLELADIAASPGVASAMAWALRSSAETWTRGDGSTSTLAAWWRDASTEGGEISATALALGAAEGRGELPAVFGLTVRVWDAVGSALGVDPVFLSRGALVPP